MSNRLRSYFRRIERNKKGVDEAGQESGTLLHGFMRYRCEKCGKSFDMFLETGIEDKRDPEHHKPCPFTIRCKYCGGMARDVSGYVKLDNEWELVPGMSYFKNDPEADCGEPVYDWEGGGE